MDLLKKRSLRPEIMDDPALEAGLHGHALKGLQRINVLSGVVDGIFNWLADLSKEKKGSLKVLDLATGGGDIPVALAKKAQQQGLPLEISACDKSATAVEHARLSARQKNLNVHFFQFDVLKDELSGEHDVLLCNLFLHHLSILQTFGFLKKISKAARQAVLVNDLQRCWPGWILASSVPPLLTTSEIVHRDGVQSVRAAYSLREIKRIAERSGLEGAQIKRIWPFRYQLAWKKP